MHCLLIALISFHNNTYKRIVKRAKNNCQKDNFKCKEVNDTSTTTFWGWSLKASLHLKKKIIQKANAEKKSEMYQAAQDPAFLINKSTGLLIKLTRLTVHSLQSVIPSHLYG